MAPGTANPATDVGDSVTAGPSWNTGVDYGRQLRLSVDSREVEALYRKAGLDLHSDLGGLARTPRIAADSRAVGYLKDNIVYNGRLSGVPVLTLHTTGDGLVPVGHEDGYANVVDSVYRQSGLLRQVFAHRAGHCTVTPAETVAAFQALVQRIDHSAWSDLAPAHLNQTAAALGPQFNTLGPQFGPVNPAYLHYNVPEFLREFDSRGEQRVGDEGGDSGEGSDS